MSGRLPLKLQVAVRDCWDNKNSPVQVARSKLRSALGYPVRIDPEWLQLLGALDTVYPDRQLLAVAVAGCVELWCKVLTDLLDSAVPSDPAQQEWVEMLMDNLQPAVGLRLYIDVAGTEPTSIVTSPGTIWSDTYLAFVLYLPAKTPVTVPAEFAAVYRDGLLNCFKKKSRPNETVAAAAAAAAGLPLRSTAVSGGDDWADIEMDSATGTAQVIEAASASRSAAKALRSHVLAATAPPPKLDYLPSVESLPRPDQLLLRPPYHITVSDYSTKKVVVNGSHSPSLHLLGEYLKRWCRANHHNTGSPPAVEVQYNQSSWGTSPMYDRVTLTSEANNTFEFNPAMVLAFVEGVLGYDLVSTTTNTWMYRRTVPFKG